MAQTTHHDCQLKHLTLCRQLSKHWQSVITNNKKKCLVHEEEATRADQCKTQQKYNNVMPWKVAGRYDITVVMSCSSAITTINHSFSFSCQPASDSKYSSDVTLSFILITYLIISPHTAVPVTITWLPYSLGLALRCSAANHRLFSITMQETITSKIDSEGA